MKMTEVIAMNWERPELIFKDCILEEYIPNDSAEDVAKWIHGRKFTRDEMFEMAESSLLEIIFPFLYVNDDTLPYVLGVYLLILVDRFEDDFPVDLAVIHYSYFARDSRFLVAFEKLDFAQKWIAFLITKKLVSSLRIMLDSGEENFISYDEIIEIENILDDCCKFH